MQCAVKWHQYIDIKMFIYLSIMIKDYDEKNLTYVVISNKLNQKTSKTILEILA